MLPQRRQNSTIASVAAGSPSGSGVSSAHRPSNSVENPESGPEYYVPAIGWPGTNCTPAGSSGPTSRITDILVLPVSVTIAPGFSAGAIAAAIEHRLGHIRLDPVRDPQRPHPIEHGRAPVGRHQLAA